MKYRFFTGMPKVFSYTVLICIDFFPKILIFVVIYTDFVWDHSGMSAIASSLDLRFAIFSIFYSLLCFFHGILRWQLDSFSEVSVHILPNLPPALHDCKNLHQIIFPFRVWFVWEVYQLCPLSCSVSWRYKIVDPIHSPDLPLIPI